MSYRAFVTLIVCSLLTLVLAVGLVVAFALRRERQTEANQSKIQLLERNQRALKDQGNKVSALLNVPPLRLQDPTVPTSSPQAETNLERAFQDALSFLQQEAAYKKLVSSTNDILANDAFKLFLERYHLEVQRLQDLTLRIHQGPYLFSEIRVFSSSNTILLRNLHQQNDRTFSLDQQQDLIRLLAAEYPSFAEAVTGYRKLVSQVRDFVASPAVARELAKKRIDKEEQPTRTTFLDVDQRLVARLTFDQPWLKVSFNGQEIQDFDAFIRHFTQQLEQVDGVSQRRRKSIRVKQFFLHTVAQPKVQAQLDALGLRLNTDTPREDESYLYYDLIDAQNVRQGSFALQKWEGELYLMDSDDVQLRSLKSFFDKDFDLETYVLEGPSRSMEEPRDVLQRGDVDTFLLIGTHDQLADSIMLILSDHSNQRNVVVSLPRDLYFRGHKINGYYLDSGTETFIGVIEAIIARPVDYYIVIDMYAFVEVVDLLGGLDIQLEEDLVDSSYVVRTQGKWQTLNLKKGRHRLTGLQVLSLSRSRYSSSDFARSKRQQQIITALARKLREVKLTDVTTLLALSKTLSHYIDTNLSPLVMGRIWMKVKDYSLERGGTIDDSNLLYSTYTNLVGMSPEEVEQLADDYFKGAFILLPRGGNWQLIPHYISTLLTPPSKE